MTKKGAEQLREELTHLKHSARREVIAAIAEARAHGDLKENAEYHAAKEKQGFIEGRIADIESKLAHAQVIDVSSLTSDKVVFGATVNLLDLETEEDVTYQIVGVDEADIKCGKISISSPIARALIGKEKDDVIDVETPKGIMSFEITNIIFN